MSNILGGTPTFMAFFPEHKTIPIKYLVEYKGYFNIFIQTQEKGAVAN